MSNAVKNKKISWLGLEKKIIRFKYRRFGFQMDEIKDICDNVWEVLMSNDQ